MIAGTRLTKQKGYVRMGEGRQRLGKNLLMREPIIFFTTETHTQFFTIKTWKGTKNVVFFLCGTVFMIRNERYDGLLEIRKFLNTNEPAR